MLFLALTNPLFLRYTIVYILGIYIPAFLAQGEDNYEGDTGIIWQHGV